MSQLTGEMMNKIKKKTNGVCNQKRGGIVSRIEGRQYEKQCGEKSLANDMLLLELIWKGSPIH